MALIARLADRARSVLFSFLRLRTFGALAIPVDADGRVVLVRLTYGPGGWRLPGGGVHRGETFSAAAAREAREEAGVGSTDATKIELLGLYSRRQGGWLDHVAVYVIDGWEYVPSRSWEVAEVGHFDPDDLPPDVAPPVRRRIDEWRGRVNKSNAW